MKKKNFTKTALASIVSLGLLAGSVNAAPPFGANADNNARGQGNNGDISLIVDRIFSHLDADESGTISLDEFIAPKLAKAVDKFAAADEDADGLVSLADLQAERTPPESAVDPDAMRECMAEKLGIELEAKPSPEERFDLADTNDDGFLDWDEYSTAVTDKATTKFNAMDQNADGELSNGEVTSSVATRKEIRKAKRECYEELSAVDDVLGD